jgi:hypothetical protein
MDSKADNLFDTAKHPKRYDSLSLAQRGINKAEVVQLLSQAWELKLMQLIQCEVTHYHIKQWSGHYFASQLHDGCITIQETLSGTKQPTSYQVIYSRTNAATVRNSMQVLCSFRASPYGNFVLVQATNRAPYNREGN